MKTLHYSIIVIVLVIAFVPQFSVLGQEVNMKPHVKPEFTAQMDKMYYNSTDTAHVAILGPPSTPANLVIIDSSSQQKIATIVQLNPNGTGIFSFNLTSYNYGIYTAMVGYGYDRVKIGFGVGIVPAESGGILVFNFPKSDYKSSEIIPIQGNNQPNSMVQIDLIDPLGVKENSTKITSNNSGKFWADLGVPANAVNGTWKILATSGVNHTSKDIIVTTSNVKQQPSDQINLGPPPSLNHMRSPLEQFKSGIASKDVKCGEGFQRVIKSEDGHPACVKPGSVARLLQQGWMLEPYVDWSKK